MKLFLVVYLVVYVLVGFVLRSWWVWRRTGVNPVVIPRDDSAHAYVGRVFAALLLAAALSVAAQVVSGPYGAWLGPLVLPLPAADAVGIAVLVASLAWIAVAQAQMGQAWRIGVDRERATELVTGGVFRWSRNPIFLGMLATMAGLFCCIPSVATLLIVVVGYVVLQIQVRLEEEHLLELHGEKYGSYAGSVRRWL